MGNVFLRKSEDLQFPKGNFVILENGPVGNSFGKN